MHIPQSRPKLRARQLPLPLVPSRRNTSTIHSWLFVHYAEYGLNENGTVSVSNGCQLGNRSITIEGTASAADEIYGSDGVFRVQFPGQPGPECPGPNYIVQQ